MKHTNKGMDSKEILQEANVPRIVACWNACAGINPEAVGDMLEACVDAESAMFHVLADGGFDTPADRDAMYQALVQVRKAVEAAKAAD